ncbi:MAG: pteridine reductase [Gammaproteobacteria bacterium]
MSASQHPESLEGRWALVTGAAKRIGAVISAALHEAGANVAIHYLNSAEDAEQLASKLNETRSDSAVTVRGDLHNTAALKQMIDHLIKQVGRLDILVNNASSFYPTPLESITEQHWDDLLGINLKAPLFLSKVALPHLKQNGGVIINIVDVHAQRPLKNHPVYSSAKAGLAMLTRSLAKDLSPEVRVNGVSPGAILWPESGISEQLKKNIIAQIPLKRPGAPADIAAAVVFLVRDAPYITGEIIAVDGGRSVNW